MIRITTYVCIGAESTRSPAEPSYQYSCLLFPSCKAPNAPTCGSCRHSLDLSVRGPLNERLRSRSFWLFFSLGTDSFLNRRRDALKAIWPKGVFRLISKTVIFLIRFRSRPLTISLERFASCIRKQRSLEDTDSGTFISLNELLSLKK